MHTSYANATHGWGEECFRSTQTGISGGICFFRVKHFLALQAFSAFSLARIGTIVLIKI